MKREISSTFSRINGQGLITAKSTSNLLKSSAAVSVKQFKRKASFFVVTFDGNYSPVVNFLGQVVRKPVNTHPGSNVN